MDQIRFAAELLPRGTGLGQDIGRIQLAIDLRWSYGSEREPLTAHDTSHPTMSERSDIPKHAWLDPTAPVPDCLNSG